MKRSLFALALFLAVSPALAQEDADPAAEEAAEAPAEEAPAEAAPAAEPAAEAPAEAPEGGMEPGVPELQGAPAAASDPCARDWKAFETALAQGGSQDAGAGLDQLGDAWVEAFGCAQRATMDAACAETGKPGAKAQKKACGGLKDAYEAAAEKLEGVDEAVEKEGERLDAGLPSKNGELKGEWWKAAATPEGFGAGLQSFVRWYYRVLGSDLEAKLNERAGLQKRIFDLTVDLDSARQLELSKDQIKAMKKEIAETEKKSKELEKYGRKEGAKLGKEARGKLKAWSGKLEKALKARRADKKACACGA